MRKTPILTFINKLDRYGKDPIELLDEIESVLKIKCAPVTWPIGMGKDFVGIYHLYEDVIYLYEENKAFERHTARKIIGLNNPEFNKEYQHADEFREQIELVRGASHNFDLEDFLAGNLTPVFFGSAINNFGVRQLLNAFSEYAPCPQSRKATKRDINPSEEKFTGFVFKIQANMDPAHRDRIALLRICSGKYEKGMKIRHVRIKKDIQINNALTFLAGSRSQVEQAFPGDIIGLHNHGTIQIGDTFTQGEDFKFTGIPHFAPELFKIVRLKDPLKSKSLQKGLDQLSEEGATQVFRPLQSNDLILGAIGVLQFDVVAYRLKDEYNVKCSYESAQISAVRWIQSNDNKKLTEFKEKLQPNLAIDAGGHLCYLAPSRVNLQLTMQKWPEINFNETREH